MQVEVNQHYIRSRVRLRRVTSLVGLLMVVVAFSLSFLNPRFVYLLWPITIGVFLITAWGKQLNFEWSYGTRSHDLLAQALKPFGSRYWLGSYIPLSSGIISHVLVGPEGALVLVTRRHRGVTTCADGRWIRRSSFFSRLFGPEPSVGDPGGELERQTKALSANLEASGISGVPVSGAVVFTSPDAQLILDNCSVTVLSLKQLETWARRRGASTTVIDDTVRQQVTEHLAAKIPGERDAEPAS